MNKAKLTQNLFRQLALTLLAVMLTATAAWADEEPKLSGSGTESDPYLITSAADWSTFANKVSGGNTYSGEYINLTADITVSEMVGTVTDNGNLVHPFSGTFNGCGHTLTFNLGSSDTPFAEDYAAPFRCVDGATFWNLHTEGEIKISKQWAAGLIGYAAGDIVISSCWSSVTITSSTEGDGTHAGFIAFFKPPYIGSINIENCLFDGKFVGENTIKWGGFVGWSNTGANLTNCLFAPETIQIKGGDTESGTFIRKNDPEFTITNCYYTNNTLGDLYNSIDASTMSSADLVSALGNNFEVSNNKVVLKLTKGSGIETDPYIITTTAELDALSKLVNSGGDCKGKYFKLGADITYSYAGLGESASNFTAIGNSNNPFKGNFDGDGKTISGIRIYNGDNCQGLFGCIEGAAIVENIILTDTKITGSDAVGGIVGFLGRYSSTGTIRNCIVADNVYISANFKCGGIVGIYDGFLSNNLVVNAEINSPTGAICGYNVSSINKLANNFYYNCKVGGTENATNVGSVDGDIEDHNGAVQAVQITAAKSISIKSASDNILSYSGDYYTSANTVVQVSVPGYETIQPTVTDIDGDEVVVTPDADGNYIFTMPDKDVAVSIGEGEGTEENPYIIKNPDDLRNFAKNVNDGNNYADKHFLLVNDLDMSGVIYVPIGKSKETPFSGIFDGGGNTISNINMTGRDENNDILYYGGIFGYCDNSTIKNVTLDNSTFYAAWYCGGIVGDGNRTTTVENCHVTDKVTILRNPSGSTNGGIAGTNVNVYGCTSAATVNSNSAAGGIVGDNSGNAISDCLYLGTSVSNVNKNLGAITAYNAYSDNISNNFYTHYGLGGMRSNDVDGKAQYALTSTTQPEKIGKIVKTYSESGITAYEHGLYYNGLYYFAPDLIIDGDSENSVAISESQTGANVLYRRNITAGIPTTIMLPFNFDASAFGGGTFYTFTGIDTEKWEATMTETASSLSANTPYIYIAEKDMISVVFAGVTIEKTEAGKVEKTDWTFQGTYENKVWNTNGEIETKKVYGFTAQGGKNNDGESYAAGEFVRARYNVSIKATRAYLQYTGSDENLSKSALVLPDRIKVVFIDKETASVIDDPTVNPSADEDGDITTPTSEIQPTANVKVWSYDKTIFIQARPGTDYRIIDANGRLLRTATTQTDRDEIHLSGKADGIVIVNIGGKSFKIRY